MVSAHWSYKQKTSLYKGIGILTNFASIFKRRLRTTYSAHKIWVIPYIGYGNLAWGGAPKTKIQLINSSVKRSIRTMIEMDKFDFVKPFHEYLNILSFNHNMKKLLQGRFM